MGHARGRDRAGLGGTLVEEGEYLSLTEIRFVTLWLAVGTLWTRRGT
jgi:hypothetical protein